MIREICEKILFIPGINLDAPTTKVVNVKIISGNKILELLDR